MACKHIFSGHWPLAGEAKSSLIENVLQSSSFTIVFIYLLQSQIGQLLCLIFWVLFDHMTFGNIKPGITSKVE